MGFIMTDPSHLWPGGTIPYVIGGGIATDALAAIRRWNAAIGHHICFVPRNNNERDYVYIRVAQGTSSSKLGRQGNRQDIAINLVGARSLLGVNLNSGSIVGLLVHEMGHAAGLLHEQQRHDRNASITVHWNLIIPGRCTAFWSAGDTTSAEQQTCNISDELKLRYQSAHCAGNYDPDSVMHYLSNHAAINTGTQTMTLGNASSSVTGRGSGHGSGNSSGQAGSEPFPGQLRGALSEGDTAALRELYPLLNWFGITGNGPSEKHGLLNRSTTQQVRDDLSVRGSIRQQTPLGLSKYEV